MLTAQQSKFRRFAQSCKKTKNYQKCMKNKLQCNSKERHYNDNGKSKIKNWEYFVWFLFALVIFGYYKTNMLRAKVGYFEDGTIIFWNSIFYVAFFALFVGYVVAKVLDKVKVRKSN